jgi:phosphoglycolate phosphatase-like HAD superfamily hydrolase
MALACGLYGHESRWIPILIGDTPYDVACGSAIGAKVVAVATGTYSVEELRAGSPWWVVSALPPPGTFVERVFGSTATV